VAGAYTSANNCFIPPERITCKSSMQSALAAIPAMIADTFPAGFTPAETTRVAPSPTRSATSSDSPALLGQRQHRDQTRARHQMLVVEQWRGTRPHMR
jgi:hypothetical protein